jgi:poly-gamma-glutamate synthase PgsB/CapB
MILYSALKFLAILLLVLFAGIGIVLFVEMRRHEAMLRRIPIRIHVNGTRGKSSVTRLIAAGLRAGGVRTFAKTTGSAAKLVHLDGREEPVVRHCAPNIREQLGIVRRAAKEGAEVLVIECMAIRPDLQRITEKRIVRSTIGVITNIRPDHLEVMGPSLDDVARSLTGTIPRNGKLFTADQRYADYLGQYAQLRGSTLHVTTPDDAPNPHEMKGFKYIEIPENVALALDVCEAVGVDRQTALQGMYNVTPDIGATTLTHIVRGEKRVDFVNAFAANDPHSTTFLWRLLGLKEPTSFLWKLIGLDEQGDPQAGVLINNRADRMRRAVDMARVIETEIVADWYVVAGEEASAFIELAARNGVPRNKMIHMGGRAPAVVLQELFNLTEKQCTVMGVGNIGGFGLEFVNLLEREGKKHDSD